MTADRDLCAQIPSVHEWRQHYRMEADGWTLPRWMCWLYWFGAERIASPSRRIEWTPPVAVRLWLIKRDLTDEDIELLTRHMRLAVGRTL